MAYRLFFGVCASTIIVSACSSDETAPGFVSPDGASAGGSGTGTGGGSSGGSSNNGGAGTGGRSGGGTSGAGGASAGGGGTGNGGAGGTASGGANAGGANAGGANAGGANAGGANAGGTNAGGTNAGGTNTGGAATGGACGALSSCCSRLTGGQRTICENIASAGVSANCTAVSDTFCGDGGVVGPPGGGGDAFVNCNALATCCAALANGSRAAMQCDRIVTNGDDTICNQVSGLFCN